MGAAQQSEWFTACMTNDYQLVEKGVQYFARKRDHHHKDKQHITGFSGLMYACYFNCIDVVKILLPYEFDMMYTQRHDIKMTVYTPFAVNNYLLCDQSSCLQIALIRGNMEVANYILSQITLNKLYYSSIYGHVNSNNFNTLDILIQQNQSVSFTFFKIYKDYFLNIELMMNKRNKPNSVLLSVYFGNQEFIDLFLSLTNHELYGQLIKKWFDEITPNIQLPYQLPKEILANEQSIHNSITKIRLMQAGEAPPIPRWVYEQENDNCFQINKSKQNQINNLKNSIKKRNLQLDVQNLDSVTPQTHEILLTPHLRARYDVFTEVFASTRSVSQACMHSKSVIILQNEDSSDNENCNKLNSNIESMQHLKMSTYNITSQSQDKIKVYDNQSTDEVRDSLFDVLKSSDE